MFETCDVLVFTLGLTEGWVSDADGAVVPLSPGVEGSGDVNYRFVNFAVDDMVKDLTVFITKLRILNPGVRIILTVSPVALVATYEPRHVLVSTMYSKAALRVTAEMVANAFEDVAYFPSYEIITGPQARGRYWEADLREVRPEGVAHVMRVFKRHFLTGRDSAAPSRKRVEVTISAEERENLEREYQVVCDEEVLDA